MRPPVALVVAKAPVPGTAKTRLGAVVGMDRAADLAAAALLDTIETCVAAYGVPRCHLALEGDLGQGALAEQLGDAVAGWTIHSQRGADFAERLVNAHHDVAVASGAPVVQIGMDTPQIDVRVLREVEEMLTGPEEAVLGPAYDGGWWLLGVGGPHLLEHLGTVPMSTDVTGELTRRALETAGAHVREIEMLRDVDEVVDADEVAGFAPRTRFARAWR